jgi:hypothetical protein
MAIRVFGTFMPLSKCVASKLRCRRLRLEWLLAAAHETYARDECTMLEVMPACVMREEGKLGRCRQQSSSCERADYVTRQEI